MNRTARTLLPSLIALWLVALGHSAPAPVTRYVATDGNDAWSGTLPAANEARNDGPFATLARAREALRALKSKDGLPQGASVLVRGGIHCLGETFTLGPADSGPANAEIVYASFPGEKASLQGSVRLRGWRPYRGHIWQADLPARLREVRFWQLFHRGKRQILARTPNLDSQHPRTGGFSYVAGEVEPGSKVLLPYHPDRLDPARWSNAAEARVHVWSWHNWNRDICPIKTVDVERHVITLAQPARYQLIEGNRFYVDNLREELDSPGEWYCDREAGRIYFWPSDGEDPAGEVTVPVLGDLIALKGDSTTGDFVSHVHFRGFEMSETNDRLVLLSRTAYCSVTASTLTLCGATALQITDGAHHNRVAGCDIQHVGGQAVSLEDTVDWTHRPEGHLAYNVIDNNHVHDVGEGGDAWSAIGLWPGCGGNASHDNVISHNLVHDTPRQGISFNGMGNVVEYNHVHHTNQEQSDTGAIGMGSRDIYERGSIIRYNYVHDTGGYNMLKPGVWEYPHYCWGIYLDDYTSGVHVYGNLVVNTYRGAVMVHGGQDNVIENNIFVDGASQQIQYSFLDSLTRGRTPAHPDKGMWLMTGTKCLGNVFCYSGPTSDWIRGAKWRQTIAESDRNVIWHGGKPVTISLPDVVERDGWDAWQKLGFDRNSVIADPLFVDAPRGDYRLQPDSPALKLGFKPLPFEQMGLYKSTERASWPVSDDQWREEHLRFPENISR